VGALFVPPVFAAVKVRERLLPSWAGANARVVELVCAATTVLSVSQLLGMFGAFRAWALYPAIIVVSAIEVVVARTGWSDGPPIERKVPSWRRWELGIVVLLSIFVLSVWAAPFFSALASGPVDVDTQTYHLPNAARFVQEGWLTRLHHATPDNAHPYHPANSEVIHALLIMAFGSDFGSLFVNHLWAIALIGAGWSFGSRWRTSGASAGGMCLVLATPSMVSTQPGSAMNDTMGLAMFVAALALLTNGEGKAVPTAIAGLAAGVAVGTKLTLLVPVIALTLALPVFATVHRRAVLRPFLFWCASLSLTGSYWFIRNWVRVGNPVPALGLDIGPVSFRKVPMKLIDHFGFTVAEYLFDGDVWRSAFRPGLANAIGRIWPIVVMIPLVALVITAFRKRDLALRALALVGLVGVVGYMATPATAFGLRGQPVLFAQNVRYVFPSICLGLIVGIARLRRWSLAVTVFIVACTVATSAIPAWPPGTPKHVTKAIVVFGIALVVAGVVWVFGRSPTARRAVVIALIAISFAGGFVVREAYLRDRYSAAGSFPQRGPWGRQTVLYVQQLHDMRIGIAGFFLQYGMYGSDLSNDVEYVGELRPDGSFTDITTCAAWRTAVNEGRYDYIVVMPPFERESVPLQARWTRLDEQADEVFTSRKSAVYRIAAPLDPEGCA
jgi:hypothetical protein